MFAPTMCCAVYKGLCDDMQTETSRVWAVGDASPYTYVVRTIRFVWRHIEGDWFELHGINQSGCWSKAGERCSPLPCVVRLINGCVVTYKMKR